MILIIKNFIWNIRAKFMRWLWDEVFDAGYESGYSVGYFDGIQEGYTRGQIQKTETHTCI